MVAEITRYPDVPDGPIEAAVLKVLGDPDDPRTEVEKVLACADVERGTSPTTSRASPSGVPTEVRDADRADRADLRDVPFTTIDPETARDFDDAVAIEALPNGGTRLWVAVADVSHYVREGSPLDAEARRRGCSIYLPNRAIPMLPEPLSAHICSLVPEEDGWRWSSRIDLDRARAAVVAQRLLRGGDSLARAPRLPGRRGGAGRATRAASGSKYEPFLPDAARDGSLARQLRAARLARGALDFDLPEPFVELDHDDPRLVRDIRKSRRDPGERQAYSMIEEFMLAANEAVARSFHERGEDTLWRIHDAPDRARLEEFAVLARALRHRASTSTTARTPKGLKRVLDRLKGHPAEKPLSFQLLRSLKQATYDVVNLGHFGLASTDYLHFTSPIRRYPDLIVHRLLKSRLAGQGKPAGGFKPPAVAPAPDRAALQKMAADSSFSERAGDGGRARGRRPLPRVLPARSHRRRVRRHHLGRRRVRRVRRRSTSRSSRGWSASRRCPTTTTSSTSRPAGWSGRRSGRTFALGDSVRVEVQSVSVVRRKVDFALAGHRARHHDGRGDRYGRAGQARTAGAATSAAAAPRSRPRAARRAHGRGRQDKRRGNIPVAEEGRRRSAPAATARRGKPKKRR